MAYRFNTGAQPPLSQQIRQIFREEIDSAVGHLQRAASPDRTVELCDQGIHEARKNIKKVRALLRLLAPHLSKRTLARENRRFRDVGRKLSSLRDAQAMLESFAALPDGALPLEAKNILQQRLEADKARVYAALDLQSVLQDAVMQLKSERSPLDHLSLPEESLHTFDKGLVDIYRQGRQALHAARAHSSAVKLHDFRKRVKDHWYHTRLLADRPLEFLSARIGALRELETLLGEAHNLHVLRHNLLGARSKGAFESAERLSSALQVRENELATQALALGETLYALKPRHVKRQLNEKQEPLPESRALDAAHA